MTANVAAEPHAIVWAAAAVEDLQSMIAAAGTEAAAATTTVAAPGADLISEAAAQMFNDFGLRYQGLVHELADGHEAFAATLATAGRAFAGAESAIAGTLGLRVTGGSAEAMTATAQSVDSILIMGGVGWPIPSPAYMNDVLKLYLSNFTGPHQGITTPAGSYPTTGVKDLTLGISTARGLTIADNVITGVLGGAPSSNVVSIFGYSQSAVIATMEMPKLLAHGYNSNNAFFCMVGNPCNPNGGLFARFPELSLPSLGLTFGAATPSNDFPTRIWSIEYDGWADFPQYPINILSDLNSLIGMQLYHGTYSIVPQANLNAAVTLTQSGAPSMSQYYMIPTHDLPLVAPLRAIPLIGKPLADLVEPDLRYLVNWGYGDINYGWSTSPADIATPFGFLPPWQTTGAILGPALIHGTEQGISAFTTDLAAMVPAAPQALPNLAHLTAGVTHAGAELGLMQPAPTIDQLISELESANNDFATGLVTRLSGTYSALLPTADIVSALGLSLPSYNVDIFLDGIRQAVNGDPIGGLVNAFGRPLAADVGIGMLAAGFELTVAANAFSTLMSGVPVPSA